MPELLGYNPQTPERYPVCSVGQVLVEKQKHSKKSKLRLCFETHGRGCWHQCAYALTLSPQEERLRKKDLCATCRRKIQVQSNLFLLLVIL